MRPLLYSILFVFLCSSNLFAQTYKLYVAAESEDEVYRISFDAASEKGTVEKAITVGEFPTEIEGPHGIGVDPSGDYWFVTLGHGIPYGHLYKYETGTDRLVTRTELGMFPATLDISEQTGWVYAVNFNLHGDHEVSTLSVVDGETMQEIERIETGIMPHGSRLSRDGSRQYHTSMMTDELFEIDAFNLEVSRVLKLSDRRDSLKDHRAGDRHPGREHMSENPAVKPTWASPSPVKPEVYVAGNGNDKIYVVDLESWVVKTAWDTPGKAPYNLEPTHDGKQLVVSYKGEGAVGVWDIEKGTQLAKIPNSRKVTHGVVISPDNRYAFISVEGIGGEPGSVDVINLNSLERVDVIEIGKQAGGIAFWKMVE